MPGRTGSRAPPAAGSRRSGRRRSRPQAATPRDPLPARPDQLTTTRRRGRSKRIRCVPGEHGQCCAGRILRLRRPPPAPPPSRMRATATATADSARRPLAQPTSSPARIANSTKPAPGNTATPSTAWSVSQLWVPATADPSAPLRRSPAARPPRPAGRARWRRGPARPRQPRPRRRIAKTACAQRHTSATRRSRPPVAPRANPPSRPPRKPGRPN